MAEKNVRRHLTEGLVLEEFGYLELALDLLVKALIQRIAFEGDSALHATLTEGQDISVLVRLVEGLAERGLTGEAKPAVMDALNWFRGDDDLVAERNRFFRDTWRSTGYVGRLIEGMRGLDLDANDARERLLNSVYATDEDSNPLGMRASVVLVARVKTANEQLLRAVDEVRALGPLIE